MNRIPVIIDGQRCGTLQMHREGAYMVCSGSVNYTGDVLRLWVYGNGAPVYLGVLIPDGKGGGSVRKKFGMSDYSRLPHPIQYCGVAENEESSVPKTTEEEVVWYAVGDGTLVRREGKREYIAFPAEGVHVPRGGEFLLRQIEGRQYVVFRI